MSHLTLLGYIIAAVAIVLGLILMFKKNGATEQQPETATALPVVDPALGEIPVVPRNQREQLQQPVEVPLVAPAEEAVLEQASLIKPGVSREPIAADHVAAQPASIHEDAIAALLAQPEPQLDHGTELDHALNQLEAATDPEHVEPQTHASATVTAEVDAPTTATLNPMVETASVSEWQGESALLDAHIEDQSRRDDESALAQAEHILALYVMPPANRTISGERAFQLLRQFGLRYGEMSLFHRFQDAEGTGPLMFSVLRYTSEGPSGFDLETLAHETVEGLAFFLALPGKHAVSGYDMMVSISGLLAREVGGAVYDEHMNELTPQLREHYRHFVLDYRSTQA